MREKLIYKKIVYAAFKSHWFDSIISLISNSSAHQLSEILISTIFVIMILLSI